MKKYDYGGGVRVGMRTGSSTLNWLLGGHLGSKAITTSESGNWEVEVRCFAWGKDRYTCGTTPTSFCCALRDRPARGGGGLYDYQNRFYDPVIKNQKNIPITTI